MNTKNRTLATEFILLGFSQDLRINITLFMIFLLIYLVSINANCLIWFLVLKSSNLHTPMYFFLCVLSFIDMCVTSSVMPKLLADLISGLGIISLAACRAQIYINVQTVTTECLLLAVMAYDRYVAICRPLRYVILMRWSNCYIMTTLVWILSFITCILPAIGNPVKFCYPNLINHFMCEPLGVIQLVCGDIHSSESSIVVSSFFAIFIPFLLILISYICILSSVLKMRSAGRAKAMSTCTSHITVVLVFYGTLVVMYFGASAKYATNNGKYLSAVSNILCPTLNPLIYFMNNKDVKQAQRKIFSKFKH